MLWRPEGLRYTGLIRHSQLVMVRPFDKLRTVSKVEPLAGPRKPFLFFKELKGQPKGLVEKATLRGGINSRPYGRQLLIIRRAGHLALPKGFFNTP